MIIIFSAIPALQPIIHDLFVLRTASGSEIGEDLETQREVVVSMLLRLVHYPEVGWNVSWLVRRSDSKTLDQAFGWLVCRLLSQFLSFRIQLVSQSVNQSVGHLIAFVRKTGD